MAWRPRLCGSFVHAFEWGACRSFEVEYEAYGVRHTHELKPGGSNIPLTNDNRCALCQCQCPSLCKRVWHRFSKNSTAAKHRYCPSCS